jgi:hypothetical protein
VATIEKDVEIVVGPRLRFEPREGKCLARIADIVIRQAYWP